MLGAVAWEEPGVNTGWHTSSGSSRTAGLGFWVE